jgi:signal transduction histidine kinase
VTIVLQAKLTSRADAVRSPGEDLEASAGLIVRLHRNSFAIGYVNSFGLDVLGYDRKELLQRPVGVLLAARSREAVHRAIESFHGAASSKWYSRLDDIFWAVRRNGMEIPVRLSLAAVGRPGANVALDGAGGDHRSVDIFPAARPGGQAAAAMPGCETTVATVAEVAVRSLADYAVVEMAPSAGLGGWVLAAAARAAGGPSSKTLAESWSHNPLSAHAARALETGVPTLISEVTDPPPREPGSLQPRSLLVVPLRARSRTLGAITFLSTRPGRRYSCADVAIARELGTLAAHAIEKDRLLHAVQVSAKKRERMAEIVTHELSNTLSAAMLWARLLSHQHVSAREADHGAAALTMATDRVSRLIADLRDAPAIESGRFSVDVVGAVAPCALVSGAVRTMRPLAATHVLGTAVPTDLPAVSADEGRIQQVLVNLIDNAIKFTPPGGTIIVGAHRSSTPDQIFFFVRDTGIGIDDADQARLFERWWQVQPGHRLGSGLGLTICKGILDAHGSSLHLSSRRGQGSTFSFALTVGTQAACESPSRCGEWTRQDPRREPDAPPTGGHVATSTSPPRARRRLTPRHR